MNFFIEIALEQKIELPFKTIREYIVQNYEGGENVYIDLNDRYQKEIKDYTPKKKGLKIYMEKQNLIDKLIVRSYVKVNINEIFREKEEKDG